MSTKSQSLKAKFNSNNTEFKEQSRVLDSIPLEDCLSLISLFESTQIDGKASNFYEDFYKKLYNSGMIFSFDWMNWKEGRKAFENKQVDYDKFDILKVSMLLTAIIRSDRFDEVSIHQAYEYGIFAGLFKRLKTITNTTK